MDSGQRDRWEWLISQREIAELSEAQKESLGVTEDRRGDPRGVKSWVIANTLIEPSTKERMYDDSQLKEVDSLSWNVTEPLYRAGLVISGLREVDREDAKKTLG